ncbi:MAG TPA: FeoB-associated Cys-rich membrane protein [Lutibacter sp.]|nr:FeoB-associated Cys-rich membrane protein [Lutibacter sp.]
MMQDILVYITVFLALVFLLRNFFFKPKKKKACGKDCDC